MRRNSITLYTLIDNTVHHFVDRFSNLPRKKTIIEKFRELKMGTDLFSDFYSNFIWRVLDLEYTSKMRVCKFKHQWIPGLKDWLNSGIQLPTFISAFIKCCLSIYEQMQFINEISDRTQHHVTHRTSFIVAIRQIAYIYSKSITKICVNASFSCLSNFIMVIMTLAP